MSLKLRDAEIRERLESWLMKENSFNEYTSLIHELKMPRPSARIDIAVINGSMIGFEIKSDVDSLSRLPQQVRAFSHFFDQMSLVTTDRHLQGARKCIPNWWGIIVPRLIEGKIQLLQKRKQKKLLK